MRITGPNPITLLGTYMTDNNGKQVIYTNSDEDVAFLKKCYPEAEVKMLKKIPITKVPFQLIIDELDIWYGARHKND